LFQSPDRRTRARATVKSHGNLQGVVFRGLDPQDHLKFHKSAQTLLVAAWLNPFQISLAARRFSTLHRNFYDPKPPPLGQSCQQAR
jgi:hypothetical protein